MVESSELNETKAELKKAREQIREAKVEAASAARKEITKQMITVITTALALVAGLFWQTAINDTIKTFIPVSGAWGYEVGVALAVTITAAIAIYLLSRSTK